MAHVTDKCDFCQLPAMYDGKTIMGPWAFMCQAHFDRYGVHTPGLYSEVNKRENEPMKRCSICGLVKPISEFYPYTDARGVHRFRTECKECNISERKRRSFKK